MGFGGKSPMIIFDDAKLTMRCRFPWLLTSTPRRSVYQRYSCLRS
ncbi:hypothetical protein O9992_23620 [Vibrio lentus]|nr:hypothetical protein [Vibrio lentus]